MANKYFTADDISSYTYGSDDDEEDLDGLMTTSMDAIFGIPYQFMDSVDPRISGTELGAKYAEKIVAKMPLLFLTPCKQKFMPGFNKSEKERTLDSLLSGDDSMLSSINTSGRYYGVEYDYYDYYNYVNTMLSELSYFAGIATTQVPMGSSTKSIGAIDWETVRNSGFSNYVKADQAPVFYIDGMSTISDSFSNTTTESSLASSINGLGDQAREIQFLLGDSALSKLQTSMASAASSGVANALAGTPISGLAGGMLGDLATTGVSTVLSGGKIMFPKLWSDSSYDRSYSFDIKLVSPDNDSVSIFFNLFVPFIHLLALTLPIGMKKDPNGYKSPFLVKAFSKGLFNIEMGLVTGLSVTRGGDCQWNDDGLPTQMVVSIDIADLYSSLYMSDESGLNTNIIKNTAMLDYLSNMAGLNVADAPLARRLKLWTYLLGVDFHRIPSRVWSKLDQGISNRIKKFYEAL